MLIPFAHHVSSVNRGPDCHRANERVPILDGPEQQDCGDCEPQQPLKNLGQKLVNQISEENFGSDRDYQHWRLRGTL